MKTLWSKVEIEQVGIKDRDYPALLKEIPNPPQRIYFLGELPADNTPKIAVVGTRKATSAGRSLARKVSKDLASRGFIIVSGLAMGIDSEAHQGVLDAGSKTIAVLACGLDGIYPLQNERLAQDILDSGGAIISEYRPGTPALQYKFLERNRIISGLSVATVVIEAPFDSGALVTARLAAEQGRDVFVFPGEPNHSNYRGSHRLIRDGARLTASVEDILEDLQGEIFNFQFPISNQIDKLKTQEEKIIFEILEQAGEALRIDKIVELAKLEPQIVSQAIAALTINGIIKETERGYTV